MQEAVGGVRTGEDAYQLPESMRAYTTPMRYHVYRVNRADIGNKNVRALERVEIDDQAITADHGRINSCELISSMGIERGA